MKKLLHLFIIVSCFINSERSSGQQFVRLQPKLDKSPDYQLEGLSSI